MKKLFIFFSTLFVFLIPHVDAKAPENPYLLLDFRSESSTPILPDSIDYLTTTACPFTGCNDKTYYQALNELINSLNDNGYYFFIRLNRSDSNFGSSYFQLYIIDSKRTDINSMQLTAHTYSSHNDVVYDITSDDGSFYRWSMSFSVGSDFPTINYINSYIEDNASSSSSSDNFLIWDGSNTSDYKIGTSFPFYANFDWSFNLTNYQTTLVSDYYELYTTSDILGSKFNTDFYLWSYIDRNGFPEVTPPTPDNPNQGIEDGLGDINDSINSTDISGAEDSFGGFFDNFEDNDYGLSDIIKTPLTFIQGLSTNTCTPITLPLPFVDQNLVLPCIKPIFQEHFSPLLTVYQLITFGIISYFIVINIFKTVRGFKNPDSNNVEVLEL